MRKILIAGLAGLASLTAATPAFAQEAETTADMPFRGVYVGGSFGYDVQPNDVGSQLLFDRNLDGRFGENVSTATGANAFSTGFCNGRARGGISPANGGSCANDDNGISYSARIGADNQVGNIVYGFVGEFGKSEINDSVTGFSTTPASYTFYREVDWEASARGRLGVAVDTTLFYGTAGTGYARIDHAFFSTNTANAYSVSGKRNQFGFLGGGGIEQKLGRNFSIGMEYMYHQYDDGDTRVRVTRGTQPATNPFVLAPNTTGTDLARTDAKFRWHSIRVTGAFRF